MIRRNSISLRVSLTLILVLTLAFGSAGMLIGDYYHHSVFQSMQDKLRIHANSIIAATEIDETAGLVVAHRIAELRFFQPSSGLYAQIDARDGRLLWQSSSLSEAEGDHSPGILDLSSASLPQSSPELLPGQYLFRTLAAGTTAEMLSFHIAISWDKDELSNETFVFIVAETVTPYRLQVERFQRLLWTGLVVLFITLIVAQLIILRWGFRPLRQVAFDLDRIEQGEAEFLDGQYPDELEHLTSNLNSLIKSERDRRDRYHQALGDLSHSLKIPLAVLRSTLEQRKETGSDGELIDEQLTQMSKMIDYHLQRASLSGQVTLAAPVQLLDHVQPLIAALNKVYFDKNITLRCDIDRALSVNMEAGDLTELLGNVLDNACKWCRNCVRLSVRQQAGEDQSGLIFIIEDDGPGIAADQRREVMSRGIREVSENSDAMAVPSGQGIGLSLVGNIVLLYGGTIDISTSELGGAKFCITLPGLR